MVQSATFLGADGRDTADMGDARPLRLTSSAGGSVLVSFSFVGSRRRGRGGAAPEPGSPRALGGPCPRSAARHGVGDLTAERSAAIEARDNETKRTMSFGCSSRPVSPRSWRSLVEARLRQVDRAMPCRCRIIDFGYFRSASVPSSERTQAPTGAIVRSALHVGVSAFRGTVAQATCRYRSDRVLTPKPLAIDAGAVRRRETEHRVGDLETSLVAEFETSVSTRQDMPVLEIPVLEDEMEWSGTGPVPSSQVCMDER